MKPYLRTLPLVALLFAASCDAGKTEPTTETKKPDTPKVRTPAAGQETKTPGAIKQEMPKFGALTEDAARAVLRAALEDLGGDDASRRALLYLADVGDRAGLDAAKKLVAMENGKFKEPLPLAAIGAEALLAYGDAEGAAKALAVAKAYEADGEEPDEYLVRALGRVQGAERAQAVEALLKLAQSDEDPDDAVSAMAAGELAKASTPAATDALARIAADAKFGAQRRGAAVAGLLHAGDARGKDLAEQLVAAATAPEPDEPVAPEGTGKDPAAGNPKPMPKPAPENAAPAPDEVLAGLGVEGATEAAPYVKKTMERLLKQDSPGFAGPETASALARIFAKGGGNEFVPWLREWAKADDGFHENEASLAALALGDDQSAPVVAKQLEDEVARWASPMNWDTSVEILDVVARRGIAGSPAFREIVGSAAQVRPGTGKVTNTDLTELNLAAAHAFLKAKK